MVYFASHCSGVNKINTSITLGVVLTNFTPTFTTPPIANFVPNFEINIYPNLTLTTFVSFQQILKSKKFVIAVGGRPHFPDVSHFALN